MSECKFDYFLLRTTGSRPMYVHEIRGVVYVSWVAEKDRPHACMFPNNKRAEWIKVMESTTGCKLIPTNSDGTDA